MKRLLLAALLLPSTASGAERVLPMEEFLRTAVRNDTEFETILVDELALRYQEDLRLPAKDLVLEVKQEFVARLDIEDRDARNTASLSKLFPMTGTEAGAAYTVSPAATSGDASSQFSATLSQPVLENAFGRSTRMLKKIVGLENEVARHQIAEAYEDYLARVRFFYLEWLEAYENLKIGRSSYKENQKLLDNMRQRLRSRIAKDIDVNKVRIQVLSRKERLVSLEEEYKSRMNLVLRVLRHAGGETLIPVSPPPPALPKESFDERYARFKDDSRTYKVLRLLEEKSSLDVARDADDLLPSLDLLVEYRRDGDKTGLEAPEDKLFAGVSLKWPIWDQVERAEHEVSKIKERKAKLSTLNTHERLRTDLRNLDLQMERERELMDIADEKIGLSRSVLTDESENYTYGKASLNDYISAVNILDANRFSRLQHDISWRKLNVEWLRLTDRLVNSGEVLEKKKPR